MQYFNLFVNIKSVPRACPNSDSIRVRKLWAENWDLPMWTTPVHEIYGLNWCLFVERTIYLSY